MSTSVELFVKYSRVISCKVLFVTFGKTVAELNYQIFFMVYVC